MLVSGRHHDYLLLSELESNKIVVFEGAKIQILDIGRLVKAAHIEEDRSKRLSAKFWFFICNNASYFVVFFNVCLYAIMPQRKYSQYQIDALNQIYQEQKGNLKVIADLLEELSYRKDTKRNKEFAHLLTAELQLRIAQVETDVTTKATFTESKSLPDKRDVRVQKLPFDRVVQESLFGDANKIFNRSISGVQKSPIPLSEPEMPSEPAAEEEDLPTPPKLGSREIKRTDFYQENTNHSRLEPFSFLVRKWFAQFGIASENLMAYSTLSVYLLGKGQGQNTELVTEIIQHYREYFLPETPQALKLRPHFKRIYRDFPAVWGEVEEKNIKKGMLRAVDDEIAAVSRVVRQTYVPLIGMKRLASPAPNVILYEAQVDSDEDLLISFAEGVTYKLRVKNGNQLFTTYVTVVLYAAGAGKLFFQTSREVFPNADSYKIVSDGRQLLYQLKDRITLSAVDKPFASLLTNKIKSEKLPEIEPITTVPTDLDLSQQNAYIHAITHNLTYIWGPPGTGKSTTLAQILRDLLSKTDKGKAIRTLVVSTANTAVDELALKTIQGLDLSAGEILRYGRAVKQELNQIKELFPDDAQTIALRQNISEWQAQMWEKEKSDVERAQLSSRITTAKHQLTGIMREKLSGSKIIFCSVAKALQDETLRELPFDNLVIDEASMLAPVYLFPLIQNVNTRLIIAGDPKQLGPISVAVTQYADKWLRRDLFSLLGRGDDMLAHSAVKMLKTQRRFSEAICHCINDRFYQGQLQSGAGDKALLRRRSDVSIHEQCKGFLKWDTTQPVSNGFVGTSRTNTASRELAFRFLEQQLVCFNIKTVGIISPYRAQVNAYKREWDAWVAKPDFEVRFGTIHTFQGGECHAIILDLTEAGKDANNTELKPGKLFQGDTGKRLINVAVSRAQRMLIVIGDKDVFAHPKGALVDAKVRTLIEEFPKWRYV